MTSSSEQAQGVVFSVVGFGALFLNIIMAHIYHARGLDKATNIVMFLITLSDVGGGLVGLYSGLYLIFGHHRWFDWGNVDDAVCMAVPMLWLSCVTGTTLLVPLISVVRFIAVYLPLYFNRLTKLNLLPSIVLIFLYSLSSAIYPQYPGRGFFKIPSYPMCIFNLHQASQTISIIYGWIFNFLPTVCSIAIILFCNSCITVKLLIRRSRTPPQCHILSAHSGDKKTTSETESTLNDTKNGDIVMKNNAASFSDKSKATNAHTFRFTENGVNDNICRVSTPPGSPNRSLSRTPAVTDTFPPSKDEMVPQKQRGAGKRTKLNQTKTVVCLSLLYLTCYVQKLYIYILLILHPSLQYHELLVLHMSQNAAGLFLSISDYAVTINSFVNPLIYLFFCPRVREEFVSVFVCSGRTTKRTESKK